MNEDKNSEPRGQNGGFTLIEVMVAIAILSFGILAVAMMQTNAMRANYRGYHLTEATTLAQDRLEFLLSQPFDDDDLDAGSDIPDPRGATPDGYTIKYEVTDLTVHGAAAPNAKLITINIEMPDGRETTLDCIKSEVRGG
jgi:type IV pilus assembly protein PilV